MDKGRIAEWFLSLVMDRGQAVGVVGDLLETRAARNGTQFWCSVFRISAGNVWHDVRSQPCFVFGMALRGFLVELAMAFPFSLVEILKVLHVSVPPWLPPLQVVVYALGPTFCTGQWIAKYSHGKEVAVCVAMTLLGPPVFFGLAMLFWWCGPHMNQMAVVAPTPSWMENYGLFSLYFFPTLLGAALARRRRFAVTG